MFLQGQEITRSCKGKVQGTLGGQLADMGSQQALPTLCHSHVTSRLLQKERAGMVLDGSNAEGIGDARKMFF